jgi:hypothetical protein
VDIIGYFIATPLLIIGGLPLNLLFCYLWKHVFSTEEEEEDRSSNDKPTTQDLATMSVTKSTPSPSQKEDISATVAAAELEQGEVEQKQITQTTPAINFFFDFINNIKIFLTCLVIVQHVALKFSMAFAPEVISITINWGVALLNYINHSMNSFFMHLFFFYSGYFCPMFLNKRGWYSFLFERVKRLGIPFVLCGLFFYPYAQNGTYLFQGEYDLTTSLSDANVALFLLQLIVFNIAYTYICGEKWSPKIKCPSNLALFGISLILGLASAITTLFFPPFTNAITVPNFWQSYWGLIVFFFGGALAARNNWIEDIKVNKSWIAIYLWALVSTVVFGIFCIFASGHRRQHQLLTLSMQLCLVSSPFQSVLPSQSSSWILSIPNISLLISFPSLCTLPT